MLLLSEMFLLVFFLQSVPNSIEACQALPHRHPKHGKGRMNGLGTAIASFPMKRFLRARLAKVGDSVAVGFFPPPPRSTAFPTQPLNPCCLRLARRVETPWSFFSLRSPKPGCGMSTRR